jgi:putative ABC transport system substrate-binding protein
MHRRELITLLGGAAAGWPIAARAQPKVFRVGYLGNSTAALEANLVGPFREGLRERGYEAGSNIQIEYRWLDGNYERLPAVVAELLAAKVDVIVAAGTPASLAFMKATKKVPVVMVAVGDPIGTGLVASLARPGGNLTGLSSITLDTEGKRLELLREVMPRLSHVAVIFNSVNPFNVLSMQQAHTAARSLGIELNAHDARKPEDLDAAFVAIQKERPDALIIEPDRMFLYSRQRLMDFVTEQRLPNVNGYRELVEAGGLISYGPNFEDMFRRAAYFVDEILKGAKPSDLPVEQPTKYALIINLKVAKALGLTVPPTLLARADEVIE